MSFDCPLCLANRTTLKATVQGRDYFSCGVCSLVFMDPAQRLDAEAERQHYNTHENDPADPRYRAFLQPLATAVLDNIKAGDCGLDYGSGPGPALSVMFGEQGFSVNNYDPFFAPDTALLEQHYDFITCTETVEHFHSPATEFACLDSLLRPGGWLGIMTQWYTADTELADWHYLRDPTHVCFYHVDTLQWLAAHLGWQLLLAEDNVALLQKPA